MHHVKYDKPFLHWVCKRCKRKWVVASFLDILACINCINEKIRWQMYHQRLFFQIETESAEYKFIIHCNLKTKEVGVYWIFRNVDVYVITALRTTYELSDLCSEVISNQFMNQQCLKLPQFSTFDTCNRMWVATENVDSWGGWVGGKDDSYTSVTTVHVIRWMRFPATGPIIPLKIKLHFNGTYPLFPFKGMLCKNTKCGQVIKRHASGLVWVWLDDSLAIVRDHTIFKYMNDT